MKEAKKLWSWLAIPCIALAVLTGSILPVLLVGLTLEAAVLLFLCLRGEPLL